MGTVMGVESNVHHSSTTTSVVMWALWFILAFTPWFTRALIQWFILLARLLCQTEDRALSWFTITTNGILFVTTDSAMKKHRLFAGNYSVRHLDIQMAGTQLITTSTVGPRQPILVGEAAPII